MTCRKDELLFVRNIRVQLIQLNPLNGVKYLIFMLHMCFCFCLSKVKDLSLNDKGKREESGPKFYIANIFLMEIKSTCRFFFLKKEIPGNSLVMTITDKILLDLLIYL